MSGPGRRQDRIERAASQLFAYGRACEQLATDAAILADDGLRSASNERSGKGGHADPVQAVRRTPGGALAVRIDAYLAGVTEVIRALEHLDRERHVLVLSTQTADRELLEVHETLPYCLACDQPCTGRRRAGYDDACYRAWLRYPKTSDPGHDRSTFEVTRRKPPAA